MKGDPADSESRTPAAGPAPADGSSGATDDLQFGEVQTRQSSSAPPPSPDSDGHLATAVVARRTSSQHAPTVPTEVFVDLDTFLDMHQHAAEDTNVELGGILLGRRGTDADGRPLVSVCDSLRARHYRATRGSFKFTHETWADLQRRRAALPEATEVVGWYHTHPGWGVFLSDLDVFICNHFFAHPDDVALVIDPTSGDTGLFVRRGSPPHGPPRRLASYRLYAHRKRTEMLHRWASFFSGAGTMSNPPAVFPGRESPPIIMTSGGDSSAWGKAGIALVGGLVGAQLVLLAAVLLMLAGRDSPPQVSAAADATQMRDEVFDELIERMAIDGPEGATRSWRETALENEQLHAANVGLLSRVNTLSDQLEAEQKRRRQMAAALEKNRLQLAEIEAELDERTAEAEDSTAAEGLVSERVEYFLLGILTGVFVVAIAVFTLARYRWRRSTESALHSSSGAP